MTVHLRHARAHRPASRAWSCRCGRFASSPAVRAFVPRSVAAYPAECRSARCRRIAAGGAGGGPPNRREGAHDPMRRWAPPWTVLSMVPRHDADRRGREDRNARRHVSGASGKKKRRHRLGGTGAARTTEDWGESDPMPPGTSPARSSVPQDSRTRATSTRRCASTGLCTAHARAVPGIGALASGGSLRLHEDATTRKDIDVHSDPGRPPQRRRSSRPHRRRSRRRADLPPVSRVRRRRRRARGPARRRALRPPGVLGRAGRGRCWTGGPRSRRPWTGPEPPSRRGSPTARSTSRRTAWTATSDAGNGDRVAIHFEGDPGDTRRITYAELTADVQRAANMLTDLGVTQGDRVVVYMPLIPEAVVTMLAVARIGAVHSVVFGGFSAESLRARIEDAGAKLVITADGGWRRGAVAPLKPAVDEALAGEGTDSVEHVLVVRRGGNEVAWNDARDLWWHDVFADRRRAPRRAGLPGREPAVHPLHLGHDREAEGHPAHVRRLPDAGHVHAPQRLRHPPRDGRLLVHGRHRLDHRAHVRRLRPAGQRRHPGALRGHAGRRRSPVGGGTSSRSTA